MGQLLKKKNSDLTRFKMKSIVFAAMLAIAAARPDRLYEAPRAASSEELAHIVSDNRVNPGDGGEFSFDFETSNGIRISKSGHGSGPDGAVETQGTVEFTHPDGTPFELKFVADAEGYKPDSAALPVAPAFPHPIPQFVLDQIEKAARQKEEQSDERYA